MSFLLFDQFSRLTLLIRKRLIAASAEKGKRPEYLEANRPDSYMPHVVKPLRSVLNRLFDLLRQLRRDRSWI